MHSSIQFVRFPFVFSVVTSHTELLLAQAFIVGKLKNVMFIILPGVYITFCLATVRLNSKKHFSSYLLISRSHIDGIHV